LTTKDRLAPALRKVTGAKDRKKLVKDLAAATKQFKFIPWPGPQTNAYLSTADELFYGGGAGSGKTAVLVGLATQAHTKSIIFRREYSQIRGIEDEAQKLLGGRDGYNATEKVWRHSNGRILEFGSVPNEFDKERYQGRAHSFIGFDEITHFCLHPETEVLTDRGWVQISEVTTSDKVMAMTADRRSSYEPVTATHVFDYDGDLVCTKHKSVRYKVTPNHKMVVSFHRSDAWRFVEADNLPAHTEYPFSTSWEAGAEPVIKLPQATGRGIGPNANIAERVDTKDWAEFLGWYLSEGSCFETTKRSGPKVSIRQTKQNSELDALMRRLPWRSKWYDGEGYLITSRQLFSVLKPLGNRHEKRVPRWLTDSPVDVLKAFWGAFVAGDGHYRPNGGVSIGLCNRGLRDDCQEIAAKLGYKSTASDGVTKTGFKVYRLNVFNKADYKTHETPGLRYREAYKGKVYCLTVEPSHTFLIRVEGRVMWTGNSESMYRYLIGWNRTDVKGERCRVVVTGNPPTTAEGRWVIKYWAPWLDPGHPNPASSGELRWFTTIKGEDVELPGPDPIEVDGRIVKPRSRSFIGARLEDNPALMESGYAAVLESMPEPLRTMMREGRFDLGQQDGDYQVVPSAWIDEAMKRWTASKPEGAVMTSIGVDVAGGGADQTVIACRYKTWFDHLITRKGIDTKDGPLTAGLIVQHMRDACEIVIDTGGGWGNSAFDHLKHQSVKVRGVTGASGSTSRTRDRQLGFVNKRAETWWKFREALDPSYGNGLALPPDPQLRADLTSPTWKLTPRGVQIESKDEIRKRLGRSPDRGDAVVLAWVTALETGTSALAPGQRQFQAKARMGYGKIKRSFRR
jgi:hypothetical protein